MLKKIFVSVIALVSLTACGVQENTTEESAASSQQESQALVAGQVQVIVDGETITEEEITFTEGAVLQDVMTEQMDVTIEEGFLSAIEGHEQSEAENKWWVYTVNGKEVMVGAAEYPLSEGDIVTWELMQF